MSIESSYPEALIGKKLGMTQVFTKDGVSVPVTVIEVGPCFVLDVCTKERNGYSAVKVGFETKKQQRLNSAELGGFKKGEKGAFYYVKELRCDVEKLGWNQVGREIKASEVFTSGELVDVSGTSLGKGFQGVVRRHHMKGQPATRGTHEYRRHVGAVGCRKYPGRIFKNKRMPGHMGDEQVTVMNLEVVEVEPDNNLILVKGGIPGAKGGLVEIRKAIKHLKKEAA
jgi:large subunit ribosomal protein L3